MNKPSEQIRMPDALDLSIIDALREDAQITNKKIALRLDVAESTVASRIRGMVDDHILRVTAQRDLHSIDRKVMGFLYVSVSDRAMMDVAKDLAQIDDLISVSVTLGQSQLFCVAACQTRADLLALIADKAGGIAGVGRVSCDVCFEVVKFESGFGDLRTDPPHFEATDPKAEKDEQIIRALQADGRTSNREIARQLEVSEANIRQRLKRLSENNAIKLGVVCDPFRLGLGVIGIVRLSVTPSHMKTLAAHLVDQEDSSFVGYTSGSFNMFCLVPARDANALADFIANHISNRPGVREVETIPLTAVVKQRYDLIRIPDGNPG